jgi:PAS domain S-box-containing protein
MGSPPHNAEQQRLSALRRYDVLDTLPEEEYDNIALLASEICQAPIAFISFIDEFRQWFKSKVGIDTTETDRNTSFCNHTIEGNALFEVTNPLSDPRFAQNQFVTGAPNLRYYAGAPIINKEGYKLGTLCVAHSRAHQLSDGQKRSLRILADSVMSVLELRHQAREAEFFKNALDEIAAVCVVDSNDSYEYANEKFCKIIGLGNEDLIGKNYREIAAADLCEKDRVNIAQEAAKGIVFRGKIKNKNRKGDVTWSNATVIPYFNSRKEREKLFSLRIDVTSEVQMLEKLEQAEKLAKIGSWQLNAVDSTRHWSKGMYAIMGFDENDEIPNTPSLFNFIVPEDKVRVEASLNAVITGQQAPETSEIRIITHDNKVKCVLINCTVTTNGNGEVVMLSGTLQDITERKETEAKYKSLVEETSQMTYITDVDGRYTYASPRLKKVIGYDDEDIIGKQFSFIYDEAWRRKTIKFYIAQLTDRKEETTYILPIKTRDGAKIWLQQIATLIKENDEITGFRCVLHDITERMNTEEAMREAARLATEAKEMQQSFLGKMSHEIRTPMNGVVGMVNLLQNTALNDRQKIYVESIRESAVGLLRIINDILDVSKIEAGKMTFEETDFDLPKLINGIILNLKPAADEKKLLLASYIDSKIPVSLIADPFRLNQVLLNLVGNALKFTEKGSIVISVNLLEVNKENITLQFQVADTGIGIPQNKLDSIFESFAQADSFTTRKYGGTGLGLTIARQLIEQQEGSIDVESIIGRGTTFSFTYHCRVHAAGNANAIDSVGAQTEYLPRLDGFNILLVEDNVINQMVAQHTIESWGAGITIANRGHKAIDLLKANKYDLVLMDIQMPELNGIQTTRIIRQDLGISIPIIAMTASAMKGEKEQCLSSGMNDYFSKPFEHSELNTMLHRHLAARDKNMEKLFDLDTFLMLIGNDTDFAKQLVRMFAKNTPGVLQQIKVKCYEKKYDQLYSDVHNLKGTIGFFGKHELDDLLAGIESDLTTGNYSDETLGNIRILDQKLEQLIAEAVAEMELL